LEEVHWASEEEAESARAPRPILKGEKETGDQTKTLFWKKGKSKKKRKQPKNNRNEADQRAAISRGGKHSHLAYTGGK